MGMRRGLVYTGLVTVVAGGRVVAKVMAGRGGLRAFDVAQSVKALASYQAADLVAVAKRHHFGTHGTLVVVVEDSIVPDPGYSEAQARHRHYFDTATVNSLFDHGHCDCSYVVTL